MMRKTKILLPFAISISVKGQLPGRTSRCPTWAVRYGKKSGGLLLFLGDVAVSRYKMFIGLCPNTRHYRYIIGHV